MNIQDKIIEIGKNAKIASNASRTLTHEIRNNALQKLIINIKKNSSQILSSNKIDIANAHKISLSAQYPSPKPSHQVLSLRALLFTSFVNDKPKRLFFLFF